MVFFKLGHVLIPLPLPFQEFNPKVIRWGRVGSGPYIHSDGVLARRGEEIETQERHTNGKDHMKEIGTVSLLA